jgi:hypothetical protein
MTVTSTIPPTPSPDGDRGAVQGDHKGRPYGDEGIGESGDVRSTRPMSIFLKTLFSGMKAGEDIELRAITRIGAGEAQGAGVRTFFSRLPYDLFAWARQASHTADVYIGAAPRMNRDGTANGVSRLLSIWGDFDFKNGHTEASRIAQISRMKCLPTLVVRTGGGFHLYWRLDPAVEVDADLARAVALMRSMADKLGCDNVGDLPHVMRLPGTLNHKYDPPRPVQLGGVSTGRAYTLEQLEEMVAGWVSGIGCQVSGDEGKTNDTQHPTSDTRYPTPDTRHPSVLDTANALDGVPEGMRDVTLFRLACKLRRAGIPEIVAARLLKEAAENCRPPFPVKDAVMKVARVYARYPEGPEETHIMREVERERADPNLRAFAGGGGDQRAELFEMGGEELQASAAAGGGTEPPSLPFLAQKGYIIEGWSHVIAGYPRCGKTELLVRLCREWLDAGKSVVYFSEESKKVWEHRLARLGGDWSRISVVFALSAALDRLFTRAFGGEENVVVIDTMRNLLQLVDETDNSRIAAVLNPWVAGARLHNKTLIMAHHMRKGGGDHGEGIAGGHALMGVFDIALTLRKEDRAPTRRLVTAYARLLQPPELIYEQEADGSMRAKGDPAAVQLAEVVERVRGVLGEEWMKTAEVRVELGEPRPSQEQVRLVLLQLAQQGEIERDPPIAEEAKGRTIMWRRATQT